MREQLKLAAGDDFEVRVEDDDTIVLIRVSAPPNRGLVDLLSSCPHPFERLPAGKRRRALTEWLTRICDTMKGRILSFNVSVAHVWGQLKASWDAVGRVVPSTDSQLAATALRHGLVLVTRDDKHFRDTGVRLLNPFDA